MFLFDKLQLQIVQHGTILSRSCGKSLHILLAVIVLVILPSSKLKQNGFEQ